MRHDWNHYGGLPSVLRDSALVDANAMIDARRDAADEIERLSAFERDPGGIAEIARANEIKQRYENRCLKMAAAIYAVVNGKRPDGTTIDHQTAINEAANLLQSGPS